MVKRYSDTNRITIKRSGLSNVNIGRIDAKPINDALNSARRLADTFSEGFSKLAIDEAKRRGAEDGKNVAIEYENGVPIIPTFDVDGGPAYADAYKQSANIGYANALRNSIRNKINKTTFDHQNSNSRFQPEKLASSLKELKSNIMQNLPSNFINMANADFDQFATTSLSDVRSKTATYNFNINVKSMETELNDITTEVANNNITSEELTEDSEIMQKLNSIKEPYLKLTNNLPFYEDILERVNATAKANSTLQKLYSRDANTKKNIYSLDFQQKFSLLLQGQDIELEFEGQTINRDNIQELIPNAQTRSNTAQKINSVLRQRISQESAKQEIKNFVVNNSFDYLNKLQGTVNDSDKIKILEDAKTVLIEQLESKDYLDLDITDTTRKETDTLIKQEINNISKRILKLDSNEIADEIKMQKIGNRNDFYNAMLQGDIMSAIKYANLGLDLEDTNFAGFQNIEDASVYTNFSGLLSNLNARDDRDNLLINDATIEAVEGILAGVGPDDILINEKRYTKQEILNIVKPFTSTKIVDTALNELKGQAPNTSSSDITLSNNLESMMKVVNQDTLTDSDRLTIRSIPNSQYEDVLNTVYTSDKNTPFIPKFIEDMKNGNPTLLFPIMRNVGRVPTSLKKYLNQSVISGNINEIIIASNIFGQIDLDEPLSNDLRNGDNKISGQIEGFYNAINTYDVTTEEGQASVKNLIDRTIKVLQDPNDSTFATKQRLIAKNISTEDDDYQSTLNQENYLLGKLRDYAREKRTDNQDETVVFAKIVQSTAEQFLDRYTMETLLQGDVPTYKQFTEDYLDYYDSVAKNIVSVSSGGTVVHGITDARNDPMNIIKIPSYEGKYVGVGPSLDNIFKSFSKIVDESDDVYKIENALPNLYIVNKFKQFGGVAIADDGIESNISDLDYLKKAKLQPQAIPGLNLLQNTNVHEALSIGDIPMVLGINAFLVPHKNGFALAYQQGTDDIPQFVTDNLNEEIVIGRDVLFNSKFREDVNNSAIAQGVRADSFVGKGFGRSRKQAKAFGYGAYSRYYSSFEVPNVANSKEAELVTLNRQYLSLEAPGQEIKDPITYKIKKTNDGFFIVPEQMITKKDGLFVLSNINEYTAMYQYPKYDSEGKANIALTKLNNRATKDLQSHRDFIKKTKFN